jgi:hypothetical protein
VPPGTSPIAEVKTNEKRKIFAQAAEKLPNPCQAMAEPDQAPDPSGNIQPEFEEPEERD